jgi:hypothetical protein
VTQGEECRVESECGTLLLKRLKRGTVKEFCFLCSREATRRCGTCRQPICRNELPSGWPYSPPEALDVDWDFKKFLEKLHHWFKWFEVEPPRRYRHIDDGTFKVFYQQVMCHLRFPASFDQGACGPCRRKETSDRTTEFQSFRADLDAALERVKNEGLICGVKGNSEGSAKIEWTCIDDAWRGDGRVLRCGKCSKHLCWNHRQRCESCGVELCCEARYYDSEMSEKYSVVGGCAASHKHVFSKRGYRKHDG